MGGTTRSLFTVGAQIVSTVNLKNFITFALLQTGGDWNTVWNDMNTQAGSLGLTTQLLMGRVTSRLTISNGTNTPVWVRVHKLIPRKDIPLSETSIQNVVTTGFTDLGLAAAVGGYVNPGISLYDNRKAVGYFKIVSGKQFLLPVQGVKVMQMSYGIWKKFLRDVVVNTDYCATKGVSRAWFVETTGPPSNDSVTSSAVGTGISELNIEHSYTCTSSLAPVNDNKVAVHTTSNLVIGRTFTNTSLQVAAGT